VVQDRHVLARQQRLTTSDWPRTRLQLDRVVGLDVEAPGRVSILEEVGEVPESIPDVRGIEARIRAGRHEADCRAP
jgi:hypothetical protein